MQSTPFFQMIAVLAVLLAGCAPGPNADVRDEGARAGGGAPAGISSAADAAEARTAIRSVLLEQVAAWNRGDIEGFMDGYLRSDSLRFASGNSVQRGWQTTLSRYRRSYPDREAMGTLAFSDLDVDVLSRDRAMVFGRWRLGDAPTDPQGLFTLIFAKVTAGQNEPAWRIIHDHTSAAR